MDKRLKAAGITILAAALAGGIIALIIRSRIIRHRKDLFSNRALRRLAALGHLKKEVATVEHIRLLRDFIAWEPRPMLRERARGILARMEGEIAGLKIGPGEEPA